MDGGWSRPERMAESTCRVSFERWRSASETCLRIRIWIDSCMACERVS